MFACFVLPEACSPVCSPPFSDVVVLLVIFAVVVTRLEGISIAASSSLSWFTMACTNSVVSINDIFFCVCVEGAF